jgi:hypothetical protein
MDTGLQKSSDPHPVDIPASFFYYLSWYNYLVNIIIPLSTYQLNTLGKFLDDQNISDLYKRYTWPPHAKIKDTWNNGFPSLYTLETEISKAARERRLSLDHLIQIASWGKFRKKNSISWPNPNKTQLYVDNKPNEMVVKFPDRTVAILDDQISGFGPTYCSKLLHFALPQIFGALDTRLVQTFGKDAPISLLNLKVTWSDWGPSISKYQIGWPKEYGTWVSILNYVAQILNQREIKCPHPQQYETSGLRINGLWLPADVETALFSYTYYELNDDNKPRMCSK